MNAPVNLDRTSILRNASAIRSTWTPQARQRRAVSAKRFTQVLSRMVCETEPANEGECWAVGAPTDFDLGRLERAG